MSQGTPPYRPSEAAQTLGIPASTLRTYAFQFRAILSPEAGAETPTTGRGFRHRRYTEADLVVLRRVIMLLDDGLSYRAVLSRLGRSSPATVARAPERRRQTRRPRIPAATESGPPESGIPSGGEAPLAGNAPPRIVDGMVGERRVQSLPPQSSELDESALVDLNTRLSHLEGGFAEQSRSIDRIERTVSATFRSLQELRNRLTSLEPGPAPTQQPHGRGWLARLFGLN